MRKVAIARGNRNANGTYSAPIDLNKYAFIATDEKPNTAHIGGLEAGDTVADGEFYAGYYNTEIAHFVGHLVAVPAFTVAGDPTPKHLTVTADSDGADVTADNSAASPQSSANAGSSAPASNPAK